MSENQKDKMIDLSYIEVNATVDTDVVVNLDDVLDRLSLEKLKAVKESVDDTIACYEECRYEDIEDLRAGIADFRGESSINGSEKATLQALVKLDDNLAWKMYVALFKFIDNFLFLEELKNV